RYPVAACPCAAPPPRGGWPPPPPPPPPPCGGPIQVLAGAWTAAGRPATNGRALRPGETAGRARRQ
ncbi:hypothetical protein GSH05_20660, partial [Burkholderia pseudomallei]|nr:hypothetical protein [Burkholderia pseudomallei]